MFSKLKLKVIVADGRRKRDVVFDDPREEFANLLQSMERSSDSVDEFPDETANEFPTRN